MKVLNSLEVDDLAAYRLCDFGAVATLGTGLFIDAAVCAGAGAARFPMGWEV